MYEYGEPWLKDVNRKNSDSSTGVLSGNPTSTAMKQQIRRIWAKEIMDSVNLFHTHRVL
jgi:hypothetical protein